jgi:hypothetical protein
MSGRKILITSPNYGMLSDEALAQAERARALCRARAQLLAETGESSWGGPPTVVTVAPSNEVLLESLAADKITWIARVGRAAGVLLRLIDVTGTTPSLENFGGAAVLRAMANLGSQPDGNYPVVWSAVTREEIQAIIREHRGLER